MSSLRPLATITLLAVVGVVLYMKINETEPVIPEGVGEWTSGQLEIGGDVGALPAPGANVAATPSLDAPPFAPGGASGDAAPAWKPEPILSSKTAPAGDEAPKFDAAAPPKIADSSPIARSADIPDMPPLPESNSTAKESAGAPPAIVAVPFVNAPSSSTPSAATPANPPAVDAAGPPATNNAAAPPASAPPIETPPPFNPYAAAPEAAATANNEPAPVVDPLAATSPTPPTDPASPAVPAPNNEPITPTESSKGSHYASARIAVQGDLDRGELAQALLKLSDWYGDPSLTPEEAQEVETLLGQLAGDVIYEGPPAHRLEPKRVVKTGETLQTIAQEYNVPWELLAHINHIDSPTSVQVGQELKVIRGPFSAIVELGKRKMTLMLDRRYAGKFTIELDPTASIEEGTWKVDQKLLTPVAGGIYGQPAGATEDRGLLLSNSGAPGTQPALLRGPGNADPVSSPPASRVIRLKLNDVQDVYDILSVGSTITVQR